jgi:hypothetical protein
MAQWDWSFVSAYRLTSSMLQAYFVEKFGNYQFPIEVCKGENAEPLRIPKTEIRCTACK